MTVYNVLSSCLLSKYLNPELLETINFHFFFFCTDVELGLSAWRRLIYSSCLGTGYWVKYLDQEIKQLEAGQSCIMRSFKFKLITVLLVWSNKGMWDERGMQQTEEMWETLTEIYSENPKKISRLRNMDLKVVTFENVDWFQLARDREKWRAVLNTIVILRVP